MASECRTRTRPARVACAWLLALAGGIAGVAAAQAIVQEHGLTDDMRDGRPGETASVFFTDDTVHAWARIAGAAPETRLLWSFEGPFEQRVESAATVEADGLYSGSIDLYPFPAQETLGEWTVTLEIEGRVAYTESFSVEPLSGGVLWWGPFLGLGLLIAFIGILAAIPYGLYRLVRRWRRRRT